MAYPAEQAKSAVTSASLGAGVSLGAAVALGGAVVVGTFFGLTNYQSTYVSILSGWLVGLVVNRAGRDMPMAVAAGALALTGSALASVIGIVIGLVKTFHVPLSVVLSNIAHVFPLMPRAIGGFGFLCWALSGLVAWATVRSRGRTLGRAPKPATLGQMPGGMTYRPLAGSSDSDIQAMPEIRSMTDTTPPDGLAAPPY